MSQSVRIPFCMLRGIKWPDFIENEQTYHLILGARLNNKNFDILKSNLIEFLLIGFFLIEALYY